MCVLRVTGKHFDADRYLAASGLSAYQVYRAGEPSRGGKLHEVSGFRVQVSRRSGANVPEQVADAIVFLEEHQQALIALRSAPGVDDMRLDFAIDLRIDRQKVMAQYDYFPSKLVSLAGAVGLGLEISIYPPDLYDLALERRKKRQSSPTTTRPE
jgi:hypothetical protein